MLEGRLNKEGEKSYDSIRVVVEAGQGTGEPGSSASGKPRVAKREAPNVDAWESFSRRERF